MSSITVNVSFVKLQTICTFYLRSTAFQIAFYFLFSLKMATGTFIFT
jgi:hypothetical protein